MQNNHSFTIKGLLWLAAAILFAGCQSSYSLENLNGSNSAASTSPSGIYDGPAQLPISIVDTTMPNTVGYKVVNLASGGDLQNAINTASCGTIIKLQAGATFSGLFTLPQKSCDNTSWIIIESNGVLPNSNTRINPCYAGVPSLPGRPAFSCPAPAANNTAKIVGNSSGTISLAPGANHYRLIGLEITRPVGNGIVFDLIAPTSGSPMDHIIFDRVWVHGTAQDETTRGLFSSGGTYIGVINSYFSDFHCTIGVGTCIDAQTISGASGSLPGGPLKIVNNFLEASGENILFGGARAAATPADITVTGNHFFKPLTWKFGQPGFVGGKDTATSSCPNYDPSGSGQCPFVVKNLFELKNADRVLIENNIFENTWGGQSDQHGTAILITPLNQGADLGSISSIQRQNNIVTVVLSGALPGNFQVGDSLNISGVTDSSFDQKDIDPVNSVINTTTFTYKQVGPNALSTGGTAAHGACPSCNVNDITFRNNRVSHASSFLTFATSGVTCPTASGNFSFHDDMGDDMNPTTWAGLNGRGSFAEIVSGESCPVLHDISLNHLTYVATDAVLPLQQVLITGSSVGKFPNIKVTNNIISGQLGVQSSGNAGVICLPSASSLTVLNNCYSSYTFTHNAIISASPLTLPDGNFFPATGSTIGFTNFNNGSGGDYTLLSSSQYKNAGTDGLDLGANIQQLNSLLAGVP